jgi:prevent-host-death family protein
MTKRIDLSTAKAQFSAVVDSVLHDAEPYLIERRGKPVAALVSADDLERLEATRAGAAKRPLGALALLGLWGDVDDAEIDEFLEHIYTSRAQDLGRDVPDFS